MKTRFAAILLAGGSGTRFGGEIPKQLLKICGKSVLEHAFDRISASYAFDNLIVVAPKNSFFAGKSEDIVKPGITRQGSVFNALEYLANKYQYAEADYVLIHDAARCLLSKELVLRAVANKCRAGAAAVKLNDSLKYGDNLGENFLNSISRDRLYVIQTPQVFNFALIYDAHQKAQLLAASFIANDECEIIEKFYPEEKISIIQGESFNLKLTYADELPIFEALINSQTT
jgi:2-C-methyl-D-erythritol 4-phosphate cytidylyltransferase